MSTFFQQTAQVETFAKKLKLGTKTGKYTCAAPLNRKKK